MKIEVLVSTMNQKDLSLIDNMNIKTDTVIINQCNVNIYTERKINNKNIKMYSFNERGIGKSRNNALLRSTGDICVLADDDVIYHDNYEEIIREAFIDNPKADMIMFNVPSVNTERETTKITRNSRVSYLNFMRYGAVNIAFRRESILKANVYFSLLFGGGAKYSAGEDSLFIHDCIKKGLSVYSNTSQIGKVLQESSTWFSGFNKKYFFDKGVFFTALSKKLSFILICQYVIRRYSLYKNDISFFDAFKYMIEGLKHFNKSK